MWRFQKIDLSEHLAGQKHITFVGGGGKTSLCEYLGARAAAAGKRVLLTTTTKIWASEPFFTLEDGRRIKEQTSVTPVHAGKTVKNGKLTGLREDEIAEIGKDYDIVLIEADGSKARPLKYPAAYEPVIPSYSDRVIVVAGLDGLGGIVEEQIFRWDLLAARTGLSRKAEITAPVFQRLFEKDALMKHVDLGRCIAILNKYDACTERREVPELAKTIALNTECRSVIISSVRYGLFYRAGQE